MNIRRFAASIVVGVLGLTSSNSIVEVQAQECTASDDMFGFIADWLPKDYGINLCVTNNIGSVGLAVASTIFSGCSLLDLKDLGKDEQLNNLIALFKSIATTPADMSASIYKYMANHTTDTMDDLCSTMNDVISPCASKLIPKLLKTLQEDEVCCSQFSELIDLLNLVVPKDKNINFFLINEVVDGFNRFLCATKGDFTCGFDMFSQMTKLHTLESFTFLESMVLPFVTAGKGEECAAMSGKEYTDTASKKPATTINFGCCVHQLRPFFQSVQAGVQYIFGDSLVEILNGMIKFTAPEGGFVDSLPGTEACEFEDSCDDPDNLSDDEEQFRDPGVKAPGKNDLIDTECKMVDKCSGDKSVCSQVCDRGSVAVPEWLKNTLAYQRNLAFSGPLCYAQIPATHNSAITLADGYGNRDQLFNANLDEDKWWSYLKTNNQMLSLTDQLDIGVRFLEIDTHFFLNDFHTGHCGTLGSDSLKAFFDQFNKQLGKYGTNDWGVELLGCFPSISGIKGSEQVLTKNSMDEIKAWLNANPTDFVIVYLDTGSDITRLKKFPDLNTVLTDTFGDLLVPLKTLQDMATAKWAGGSINEFINAGHQVLALANDDTGVAYSFYDFCNGGKDLTVEFIDDLPDAKRKINGLTIYSNEQFLRSYSSQIRYVALSDTGALTKAFPVFLDGESIPKYTRWNLNLIATDNVDVAKMAAQVWSWAENEPSTTEEGAYALVDKGGRWVASTTAPKTTRACWDGKALAWSIVPFKEDCPTGTTFTAPADPYQQYLLAAKLVDYKVVDTSVVINATLTIVGAPTPVPSEMAVIVDDGDQGAAASTAASGATTSLCRTEGGCGGTRLRH
ncbi:hypothetical protein PHYBOEH_001754 [Phytophthora boehmeriae]|uniref:PLC-like phosphodiesterase n=1 Tax=Phytophthora boehmeriae TaxID=109152 RepID=A0A8T1XAJ6_9STRA|nr:hypothetical protein PHYBOEH_001754 [Phytophthora boehmeriae]